MCTRAKMQVNMKTKMNIQYTQYYALRFARKRDKIIQSRQVANYPITSNLQMSVQKNQTQLRCQKTLKCHNALFAKNKDYCMPFGGYQSIIDDN